MRRSSALIFAACRSRVSFFPTIRGLLQYPNLEKFVDDIADTSNINRPVPGGSEIQYYNWYDYFFYAQDEWKIRPNFSLTYGLRYETAGQFHRLTRTVQPENSGGQWQ